MNLQEKVPGRCCSFFLGMRTRRREVEELEDEDEKVEEAVFGEGTNFCVKRSVSSSSSEEDLLSLLLGLSCS